MLDMQLLRNDLAGAAARLATRGYALDTAKFEAAEAERKSIQTRTQELQAKRNTLSKAIGAAKGRGEDVAPMMREVGGIGDELPLIGGRCVPEDFRHIPWPICIVHQEAVSLRRQRSMHT